MSGRDELLRRQKVLGDFGDFVLDHQDLQEILQEACRLIAEALDVDLAKVLQIDRNGKTALVRAGIGWSKGVVGEQRLSLDERSSEAFALNTGQPVVTPDIEKETRFTFPDFMRKEGVRAIVNVPIILPGRKAWGLLQVDARRPRDFGPQDIEFLRTYAMTIGPVVDRLLTANELRQTDERLRLIIENARNYVIVLSDTNDIITDWLGGSEEILGWTAEQMIGSPAAKLFSPEDRDAEIPQMEIANARENGTATDVRWHIRRDGSRVFLDGQTIALRNGNGAVRGFLKIGQDVTERKRNEERQAVLLAELQHRVRNVLAMVRSLISRTIRGDHVADRIREELEGRIDAMARTQARLTRTLGAGVDLENIVREELESQAVREGAFTLGGPTMALAPKAAEIVTLALHELATNSAKYGALTNERSHLSVEWVIDKQHEPQWLQLTWRESNVPIAPAQERRNGFGTELITRRIPYELQGVGHIDFKESGLEARIGFPIQPGTSTLQTSEPV